MKEILCRKCGKPLSPDYVRNICDGPAICQDCLEQSAEESRKRYTALKDMRRAQK